MSFLIFDGKWDENGEKKPVWLSVRLDICFPGSLAKKRTSNLRVWATLINSQLKTRKSQASISALTSFVLIFVTDR